MEPHQNNSKSDQVDSYFKFPFLSNSSAATETPIQIPDRNEFYYPMKNAKCGRCIIINNEQFTGDDVRTGSKLDVDKLKYTFYRLGFEVMVHNNVSTKLARNIVERETSLDHSRFDCFVMCILSHGNKGDEICTTDGELNLEQDFISKFTPENCPTLTGKPRLFFIQACRGDDLERGTLVVDSPCDPHSVDIPKPFQLPQHADFFIFYSCYTGNGSIRNPNTGSWFIQDLCKILNQFVDHFDLATIATLVCKEVAFNRETNMPSKPNDHKKKQMPCYLSTLTRMVRFKRIG